jgi:hypothetical protein
MSANDPTRPKVIQIAFNPNPPDHHLYALREDGTIWRRVKKQGPSSPSVNPTALISPSVQRPRRTGVPPISRLPRESADPGWTWERVPAPE